MTPARELSPKEVRGLRFSSERREPFATRKQFFGLGAIGGAVAGLLAGNYVPGVVGPAVVVLVAFGGRLVQERRTR